MGIKLPSMAQSILDSIQVFDDVEKKKPYKAIGISSESSYCLSEIEKAARDAGGECLGVYGFNNDVAKVKIAIGGTEKSLYFDMTGTGGFDGEGVKLKVHKGHPGW